MACRGRPTSCATSRRRGGNRRAADVCHVLAPLLLAVFVAGCGSGSPGPVAPGTLPPGPAPASAQLRVGFGGIVDTIEVRAVELRPLRAAALIAPDGSATPASFINVDAMPRIATGQWAVSHRWDEPVSQQGAIAGLALIGPQPNAALRARQQLLAVVSAAEIPLPDPVVYRRDWQNYRIRLTFGTPPGEVETIVIAAPAPQS